MVPSSIRQQLASLRRRERALRLAWGLVRWLGVVVPFMLGACALDYAMDAYGETPLELRRGLFAALAGIAGVAGAYFLLLPLTRRLSDDELALWVEDKVPGLNQRLISAVQLNRAGAQTEGMSPELIQVVTSEAEEQAGRLAFQSMADHRRARWSAVLGVPLLAMIVTPLVLVPGLSSILLARLFLVDEFLPHRVTLENDTADVWPLGEKVVLRVRARGHLEDEQGEVVIDQDRYPLELKEHDGDGDVFAVELAPGTSDFTFRAYLGDGRLRKPGKVHFEPRPAVVEQVAWTRLPAYCDPKPNGLPYEIEQPRGEIVGIPGSGARVKVKIQKPVPWVKLEILAADGPPSDDPEQPATEKSVRMVSTVTLHPLWHVEEKVLPWAVAASATAHLASPAGSVFLAATDVAAARDARPADGTWVQAIFDLNPKETAYRVLARDRYGFDNLLPPRRSLRVMPEEAPVVSLLREQFGPLPTLADGGSEEDFEFEGLPVPSGGPLRIAYAASGPFGLGSARLRYRIVRKKESGNDETPEEPFRSFDLGEVLAGEGTGAFDPRRGAFQFSTEKDNIYFHAVPSFDPYRVPGRAFGGGRFVFHTKALVDGKGGFTAPREGDQIEYYVEVFAGRKMDPSRPSARSETRVKNVVSLTELVNWLRDTVNEERRLRQLSARQGDVFPTRK